MRNLNWNNVRQAVYVLGAGILGAAAAMGWITAEQGEQFTSALVEVLGAVALIVAAANVNKGTAPEPAALGSTAPQAAVSGDSGEGLPVYDGPTSAPSYVGKHRLDI